MMKKHVLSVVAVCVLTAGVAGGATAQPRTRSEVQPTTAQIDLLTRSNEATARGISFASESDNPQAVKRAKSLYKKAQDEYREGRGENACALAREAYNALLEGGYEIGSSLAEKYKSRAADMCNSQA